MSDYSQITNFTTKDGLTTGDPEKLILGADLDAELSAISTAVATKYDSNDIASEAQAEALTLDTVLITPLQLANVMNDNAGMVGDIQALADPGADTVLGWDDSAGAVINFTLGTGIGSTAGGAVELDFLGFEDLTDPGADRIAFWDDGGTAFNWLQVSTGLTLSGTTLSSDDSAIVHDNLSGFVANEHIDHSAVSVTAGEGLTGGGTIAASRTFDLDVPGLTQIDGNAIVSGDEFLVYDADAAEHKAIPMSGAGYRVISGSAARTFTSTHLNAVNELTGSTDRAFTLNTGVGVQGNVIILHQSGTGSIQVDGTATVNSANGLFTRTQYSVAILLCTATNTWTMFGDTASS